MITDSPTASPTLPSAANSVPPSPVPGGIESNSTTPFIPASSPSPTASPVISLNPPPKSNVTNPNFSSSLTATLSTPSPITPDRNIPVVSTLTSTVSFQAHHPAPTSNHNTTSLPPHTEDHGGLSSGAITAIAVIAGIIGLVSQRTKISYRKDFENAYHIKCFCRFVLLFWVGVQILQSKRRKREEAEMQEIDFDPSGNGSAIGDSTFPRTTVTHRQDSFNTVQDSTSYLNHKGGGRDLHDGQFDEGPRMYDESEYIDTGGYSVAGYPGYGTGVQRQYSTGSSANNFYVDSRQQAVAHGYSAYPAQYPASSAAHYDTSAVSPQHYYGQQASGYNSNSGREYNR
ncbi:hypothetical protein BY996DRAFT_485471 [Phakopsora pachyrhizi]|nr:hypothetical protein BY996DRAFT_485471 [Phakopsora pachyrhizi]